MKMNDSKLILREGKKGDKKFAEKMWRELFIDSENENKYYFDNIYKDTNLFLGELEDNKKTVTLLHKNPYTLLIKDKEFSTSYLVGIGTNLEDQGKGYMDMLLKYTLRKSKEEGKDIVFLTPIDSRIYKKYGFGYISNLEFYKTKCDKVPLIKIPKEIKIEKIDKDSLEKRFEDLALIYKKKSKEFLVKLKRDKNYYKNILKENEILNGRIYIIYKENIPMGYFIFYLNSNKILVREIILLDSQYYKLLFSFVSQMRNYYEKIEIISYEKSNLNFYMDNQLDIKKEIKPFIMARILDPKKILECLELKLDKEDIHNMGIFVEDNILTENSGIYNVSKDKIDFNRKADENNYHFKINIENLSSMVFGYFTMKELLELGKLEINDKYFEKINEDKEKYMKKTNLIFIKGVNYIQEYQ